MPPLQTWPLVQGVPADPLPMPQPSVAPQYVGSVAGLTQAPPQLTSVPGHETEHMAALHTSPLGHIVPALPIPPVPHPAVAPQ